jgi:hypothetical protein
MLGVPLLLETDSAAVLDAARAVCDPPGAAALAASRPLAPRLRVVVDAHVPAHPPGAPRVNLPDPDRLVLRWEGCVAEADAALGSAHARVSPSCLASADFGETVLEHLALFLVTRLDRTPVHAAALVHGDRAFVLAGPSGVGKSSLSYAAVARGWRVLSEDAVFVQRVGGLRLWGRPRALHLSPTAVLLFPELASVAPTLRPDGRTKVRVPLLGSARAEVPWTGASVLCFLSAEPGAVPLDPLSPASARAEMRATLQGGFHRFADHLDACVDAVSSGGCWRVGRDGSPDGVVRRLEGLPGRR